MHQDSLSAELSAALALHQAGQLDDAARRYRRIIAGTPGDGQALGFLGMAAAQRKMTVKAVDLLQRAVVVASDEPVTHNNLGNALLEAGAVGRASSAYRRAIVLAPLFSAALYNLATQIASSDSRIVVLLRSIVADQSHCAALVTLSQTLQDASKTNDADRWCRCALVVAASDPTGHQIMAKLLLTAGLVDRGRIAARRALAVGSEAGAPYFLLGSAAERIDDLNSARRHYRQSLAGSPTYAPSHTALGSLDLGSGLPVDAVNAYSRAGMVVGFDDVAESNKLFALAFVEYDDPQRLVRANRRWGKRVASQCAPLAAPKLQPLENRAIRIGYVSADFVKHGFLAQLLPVLERHDPKRFEVCAYGQTADEDSWTAEIRRHVAIWRNLSQMDTVEQARAIQADKIDVLVNLTGYQARYRKLFAYRIAPAQVGYINHVSPTGLATMDARITDCWLDPEGAPFLDSHEPLIRLGTGYACYIPFSGAPNPGPPPALSSGHVTFGVFNNLAKVSVPALDAWAAILKRVSTAKLLVKSYGLSAAGARSRLLADLGRRGIAADRIELVGRMPSDRENLEMIAKADIGLDPFPFAGGLSTIETLWMGVPVITIEGRSLVGRIGVSSLVRAGFPEWVARSVNEYVDLAVGLASDVVRLGALRQTMRERLQRSILMDAESHTREIESVYEELARNRGSGSI